MLSINWHSLDHICRDRHDLWFFQLALSVWKAILKITRSPKSKFFRVILEPNDELSLENFLPTIPFTILTRSHFNKKNNKNRIRDACTTTDIIDCLQMALSLELFEYCSVYMFWIRTSDWITVVFWGNSLEKLISADVSQCFPHNLQQFPNVLQRWK